MASETFNSFSKNSQGSVAFKRQIVGWTCVVSVLIVMGLVILGTLNSLGLLGNRQSFDVTQAEVRLSNSGGLDVHSINTTEFVVRPGDTLWAIAQSTGHQGRDVREVVDWIRQLNNLQSGSLSIGQVLLVPVAAPNP